MNSFWEMEEHRLMPRVIIDGVEIMLGSRVLLTPRPGGDIIDLALAGKVGVVEAIERDFDDNIQVAVVLEGDPGRDLGEERQPGHRFFFAIDEVEPLNDIEEDE
jgi:hypothetical protein